MDLFATKLRSAIRGVLNESRETHGGYATVVGNVGLESDWVLTVECEIIIPADEFEYFANILRGHGGRNWNLIPAAGGEDLPSYSSIEKFYKGYKTEEGLIYPGVMDDTEDGKRIRDHMRVNSLINNELMAGIFDRITKNDFDQFVQDWRGAGFSREGRWPDGVDRHAHNDPRSLSCRWCEARFNKIGGGDPNNPGGRISDEEKRRKLNSGLGGYCCGDPVRPKYFGFQRGRARRGTPEWFQYQYDELVHVIIREYKEDVAEAIIERLGLESVEFSGLRDLIFGKLDRQGIPENMQFLEPDQRFTKRTPTAPPHMQHREFEAATDVLLGEKDHRVYYVQVKIHLNPQQSWNQSLKSRAFDAENENVNPATGWLYGGDRITNYEKELRDEDDWIGRDYSGFVEFLIRSIHNVGALPPKKSRYTYTSPSGQQYDVYKIATGIKGLNFLVDPFMPLKQAELERRPEYHGEKELKFHPEKSGKLLGFHQSEMYGAYGGHDNAILSALEERLKETDGPRGVGSLGFASLAPWDPIKPFPIDINGNIYVIPDDDVLTLHDDVEVVAFMNKNPDASLATVADALDMDIDEISGRSSPKAEVSGKIIEIDRGDNSVRMRVNKYACARCRRGVKEAKKNLKKAKKEEVVNDYKVKMLNFKIDNLEEKFASSHEEIFQRGEILAPMGKTDFASEEYAEVSSSLSQLGKNWGTYKLWSRPWLMLNMNRLEREEFVAPLSGKGPDINVTGPGGLFDSLMKMRKKNIKGEKDPDIIAHPHLARRHQRGEQEKLGFESQRILEILLKYFQAYDRELLNPESHRSRVKYGEGTVDISGLDWMDKIAIPINFSEESFVIVNKEDQSSIDAYDQWRATKRLISTNVYMHIVPHSIIKKHLGIPQEEPLKPVVKAGEGSVVPYIRSPRIIDRKPGEASPEAEELADQLDVEDLLKPDEPEEEGELAQVAGGPGGTAYAPEKEPEYQTLEDEDEREEREEQGEVESDEEDYSGYMNVGDDDDDEEDYSDYMDLDDDDEYED